MNPIDRSKNNAYGGEAIGVRLHSIKFLESCGKNVTRNRKLELSRESASALCLLNGSTIH